MKCSKRHVSASVIIHKPVKAFPHLLRSCFRKRNHKNIKRIDRERRDYYRYYTGKSWENLENYDLMINTTKLSYDDMVECVVDYLKMRGILAK